MYSCKWFVVSLHMCLEIAAVRRSVMTALELTIEVLFRMDSHVFHEMLFRLILLIAFGPIAHEVALLFVLVHVMLHIGLSHRPELTSGPFARESSVIDVNLHVLFHFDGSLEHSVATGPFARIWTFVRMRSLVIAQMALPLRLELTSGPIARQSHLFVNVFDVSLEVSLLLKPFRTVFDGTLELQVSMESD